MKRSDSIFLVALCAVTAAPLAAQSTALPGQGGSAAGRGNRAAGVSGASPAAIARLIDPIVLGRGGSIGVAVYAVERELPLYLHDADIPLVPASNMKLYTTAAALDRLGPDFQYTTSLYAEGPIRPDGTLQGDVILEGRGDPTLSGRFYADSTTYVFDRFAAELRSLGVRRIAGGIVGDASYFDDARVAPGWESTNLLWWYGARTSALSFNDNTVTIEVRPGDWVGAPPRISFDPHSDRLVMVNSAVTGNRRGGRSIGIRRRPDLGGYEIRGRIPIRSGPLRYVVAVEDPPLFALSVFRDRLARAGITVQGGLKVRHDWEQRSRRSARLVASQSSPRMIEIVRVINKNSQNFFAEQVLKTLGAIFEDEGSFDEGAEVVRDFLSRMGVSVWGVRIEDGSGLSRYDSVTARGTAELLVAMADHPWFGEYYESLLIAGEDGDPRRLNAPAARGNVRTKTGTLRGVSSLSGYVTTLDGELLAFSVISNSLPRGKGGAIAIEDAVAERLAGYTMWDAPRLESSTGR
ncbi:MAG TPA: D-alanyl-D-alanine carboxypeptidase/D-alanyl-D-alanine-endopeptidase [Gemmatimonadota bacterium]|nr:D-alanyl-D-alanine carboxypeptidase/D-alanyl-D-alanine-endopeptidase [Gemmatimonadota bacterium]